mgnify:CR=1 FL=1
MRAQVKSGRWRDGALEMPLELWQVRVCGVVWTPGVVWCGVVWCGVWCGVVWCGVVWCGVVWCGVRCGPLVWCGVVCGVNTGCVLCFVFGFCYMMLQQCKGVASHKGRIVIANANCKCDVAIAMLPTGRWRWRLTARQRWLTRPAGVRVGGRGMVSLFPVRIWV